MRKRLEPSTYPWFLMWTQVQTLPPHPGLNVVWWSNNNSFTKFEFNDVRCRFTWLHRIIYYGTLSDSWWKKGLRARRAVTHVSPTSLNNPFPTISSVTYFSSSDRMMESGFNESTSFTTSGSRKTSLVSVRCWYTNRSPVGRYKLRVPSNWSRLYILVFRLITKLLLDGSQLIGRDRIANE